VNFVIVFGEFLRRSRQGPHERLLLAYVEKGKCRLISRNGNQFKSFPALADNLPAELSARSAMLDGEIVCLDRNGKTQFKELCSLSPRSKPWSA